MKNFSTMLQEAKSKDSYWIESAKLDFALELTRHIKKQSLTNADLAKRLGTSPAYITKLLRGDANLTIESMVKAVRALGCDFHMHVAPHDVVVKWLDVDDCDKKLSCHNFEGIGFFEAREDSLDVHNKTNSNHWKCTGTNSPGKIYPINDFSKNLTATKNFSWACTSSPGSLLPSQQDNYKPLSNGLITHGTC